MTALNFLPMCSSGTKHALTGIAVVAAFCCGVGSARAQNDNEVLAEELANPLAALISLPFLGNYNERVGLEEDGSQWFVNIQPVVPIDPQFGLAYDIANNFPRNVEPERPLRRRRIAGGVTRHDGRPLFFTKPNIQWLHFGSGAYLFIANRNG